MGERERSERQEGPQRTSPRLAVEECEAPSVGAAEMDLGPCPPLMAAYGVFPADFDLESKSFQ